MKIRLILLIITAVFAQNITHAKKINSERLKDRFKERVQKIVEAYDNHKEELKDDLEKAKNQIRKEADRVHDKLREKRERRRMKRAAKASDACAANEGNEIHVDSQYSDATNLFAFLKLDLANSNNSAISFDGLEFLTDSILAEVWDLLYNEDVNEIIIKNCPGISDEAIISLANSRFGRKVEVLELNNVNISDLSLSAIATSDYMTNLKCITIMGAESISDVGFLELMNSKNLIILEELYLTETAKLTFESLRGVFNSSNLRQLEQLGWEQSRSNELIDDALIYELIQSPNMENLSYLRILAAENVVSDEVLELLFSKKPNLVNQVILANDNQAECDI